MAYAIIHPTTEMPPVRDDIWSTLGGTASRFTRRSQDSCCRLINSCLVEYCFDLRAIHVRLCPISAAVAYGVTADSCCRLRLRPDLLGVLNWRPNLP